MSAADVVLTITTETKGRIFARRVVSTVVAAGAAATAVLILPSALSGGGGTAGPAEAAVAYSVDTRDLKLDCQQWAALSGARRREAATFFEVTAELITAQRAPGDFTRPPVRLIAAQARENDDSCRAAEAAKVPGDLEPLVVRALRDYRHP